MFGYDVIMADPPWRFEAWDDVTGIEKGAMAQYDCMPVDQIAQMPVGHLASPNCWLWLWATHPMLREGFQVLDAWGFKYVTSGVWSKRGISGKQAFGTGYVLRSCSEPFLIGKIGEPKTFSKSIRSVLEAPRREHSRKPDQAYAMAETLFGPARRADLFSRESRPGWTAWGNEAAKFDAA